MKSSLVNRIETPETKASCHVKNKESCLPSTRVMHLYMFNAELQSRNSQTNNTQAQLAAFGCSN